MRASQPLLSHAQLLTTLIKMSFCGIEPVSEENNGCKPKNLPKPHIKTTKEPQIITNTGKTTGTPTFPLPPNISILTIPLPPSHTPLKPKSPPPPRIKPTSPRLYDLQDSPLAIPLTRLLQALPAHIAPSKESPTKPPNKNLNKIINEFQNTLLNTPDRTTSSSNQHPLQHPLQHPHNYFHRTATALLLLLPPSTLPPEITATLLSACNASLIALACRYALQLHAFPAFLSRLPALIIFTGADLFEVASAVKRNGESFNEESTAEATAFLCSLFEKGRLEEWWWCWLFCTQLAGDSIQEGLEDLREKLLLFASKEELEAGKARFLKAEDSENLKRCEIFNYRESFVKDFQDLRVSLESFNNLLEGVESSESLKDSLGNSQVSEAFIKDYKDFLKDSEDFLKDLESLKDSEGLGSFKDNLNDSKNFNDSKDSKDSKDFKDSKDSKDSKDNLNDSKDSKDSKIFKKPKETLKNLKKAESLKKSKDKKNKSLRHPQISGENTEIMGNSRINDENESEKDWTDVQKRTLLADLRLACLKVAFFISKFKEIHPLLWKQTVRRIILEKKSSFLRRLEERDRMADEEHRRVLEKAGCEKRRLTYHYWRTKRMRGALHKMALYDQDGESIISFVLRFTPCHLMCDTLAEVEGLVREGVGGDLRLSGESGYMTGLQVYSGIIGRMLGRCVGRLSHADVLLLLQRPAFQERLVFVHFLREAPLESIRNLPKEIARLICKRILRPKEAGKSERMLSSRRKRYYKGVEVNVRRYLM